MNISVLLLPSGAVEVASSADDLDRLLGSKPQGWHHFYRPDSQATIRVRLEAIAAFYAKE